MKDLIVRFVLGLSLVIITGAVSTSLAQSSDPDPCITGITSGFNGTPIAAGDYIWFNSVATIKPAKGTTLYFSNQKIQFDVEGVPTNFSLPDSVITFDSNVSEATTTYDDFSGWNTVVPAGYSGNVFLGGSLLYLPAGLPGGIKPVTWSGDMSGTAGGLSVNWKWGAAVYAGFPDDVTLGVKPIDGNKFLSDPLFKNSDHAGTPEGIKAYVVGGARGGGGANYTGSYSGTESKTACYSDITPR